MSTAVVVVSAAARVVDVVGSGEALDVGGFVDVVDVVDVVVLVEGFDARAATATVVDVVDDVVVLVVVEVVAGAATAARATGGAHGTGVSSMPRRSADARSMRPVTGNPPDRQRWKVCTA